MHAVGGIWGSIATGLFADHLLNPGGGDGLFNGNPHQLFVQILAVAVSVSFAFVGSFILLKLVNAIVGLRVSGEDESMGLDLSEHNESAYALELV